MQVVTFLKVPFTHIGKKTKQKKVEKKPCSLWLTANYTWDHIFLIYLPRWHVCSSLVGWNRGPAMLSIFHLLLPDVWAQSSQKQNNKESKHQEAMEETQIKPGSNFIDIFSLQLGKWDCQKETAPQLSWVSVCEGDRKRGPWLKIAKLIA